MMADQSINKLDASTLPRSLIRLCQQLADAGGHGWLVGGCVRDMLLGIDPKDFDLEVYGIEAEALSALLKSLGRTEAVGKQFGVLKHFCGEIEVDVALPRTERKTASGHCGFTVQTDPGLSPEKATLRRDFTINAMMYNPLTVELLDFHSGQDDLQAGLLRHVSGAFAEDPLRPLRAMQFAARYKLSLHQETAALCNTLISEATNLPSSRIWSEWKKWALSSHPSFGLKALRDSGWINLYPELHAMIGCDQEPDWHPEGDVWIHTLQVCDRASEVCARNGLDEETRMLLLLSSLCHDIGKPETSFVNDQGRICSPGHAEAGITLSQAFLHRIAAPVRMIELILPLVKEHITHIHGQPTARAVRRLADRLTPANIRLWEMLVEADASGRYPAPPSRPALSWLELAESLKHEESRPVALLTGNMLLKLGVTAGPEMGEILKQAYQAQLDGEIDSQSSAVTWYHKVIANTLGE